MSEEIPSNTDIEHEIRKILGDGVVDTMLTDPQKWSIDEVFSDDRFTRIENKRQKILKAKHGIWNKLNTGEITEEEAGKNETKLQEREMAMEKDADYPIWGAFNRLVGLHADLIFKNQMD